MMFYGYFSTSLKKIFGIIEKPVANPWTSMDPLKQRSISPVRLPNSLFGVLNFND